jgi:hypothetical protein
MVVTIKYQLKNGTVRSKGFIRDTVDEALKFFNWRYGHKVLGVGAK